MAMQVHVLCLLQYKHKAKCLMNWYWFPLNPYPLSNTNNESYPSTPPRLLQIMCQNTAGLLTMQHSPQTPLPSDGLLWVNSSVRVGTAISVNRWHYPCIQVLQHQESLNHEPHFYIKIYHVQDITCILVSPNSLSHTVSFVLSSIFLVLVLILMISLKICHWKAAKNDKLLRKKMKSKGDSSQIVQTVPAVDQHCRYDVWDVMY